VADVADVAKLIDVKEGNRKQNSSLSNPRKWQSFLLLNVKSENVELLKKQKEG